MNCDEKFKKNIQIQGKVYEGYIDFGSQCSLIRETVARVLIKPNDWVCSDLPSLRGFGNSVIDPIGMCNLELIVDNVKIVDDLLIVSDNYLKYDILLGQTTTEQSHVEVHKTSSQLNITHCKSKSYAKAISLKCNQSTELFGSGSIKCFTDNPYSGQIVIENGIRKFYRVETGICTINNNIGYVTIQNEINQPILFRKDDVLVRGYEYIANDNKLKLDVMRIDKQFSSINLDDLNIGSIDNDKKIILKQLIDEYRDCFATNLSELGYSNLSSMEIKLIDDDPVVYRPYRLSYTERYEVRQMVDELMKNNIVRESTSPYASPVILVKKKTGDKRLCVDYRALNKKTLKQQYPLPRIEDQLDRLAGNKYFCALDMASGYYQIGLNEESKAKTAFVTPDGQFEFNRMPFGLSNAPAVFQRMVNMMLGNARFDTALAYMDDLLIPSKDFEEGIKKLKLVFEKLRNANLTLKPQKCYFFQERVDYLGFEVSENGIRPGSRKIESVANFPTPQNVHNVRQFIGLGSFFRRFIKGFAEISRPLTKLLKKDVPWVWSAEQDNAFLKLKEALTSRPVLSLYDQKLETHIHTDASKHGVGAVLLQKQINGLFSPIAYYSRQTSPEETHFSSYELESLAVICALIRFRPYVLGLSFTIVTDCNSLRATFLKRDMVPRIARWWSLIQEYDCNVVYRSGQGMLHVDALSRNPNTTVDKSIIKEIETYDVLKIDDDWIATVQMGDSEIQRIRSILSNNEYNNIVEIRKNFVLKRDKVYRITESGLKWVVPKGCRWQILQKNHDEIGHFGFDKTLERIKDHYWFSRMRRFVKKYVNACLECAHNKVPPGKKQGFLHPIIKVCKPFHTIHIDHVGPFIPSKRKNTYILVIVDAYSKFVVLKAVKNTKSNTSIAVMREYFGTFGVPSRVISDRGTSFTSLKFKAFIMEMGTKHILNAVASPRANGQVERYNRTVLDSLSAQNHGKDERLWDDNLLKVQWGLNNSMNKGTGKSPSEILFGLKLINSNEGHIISEIEIENNEQDPLSNMNKIREEVKEYVDKSQGKQKENFDRKRKKAMTFNLGDLVRVERDIHTVGKSKKLLPKLSGPYRITKIFSNDRYEVTDTPLTKKSTSVYKGVFAVDKIYPWLCYTRNESDDSSGNEQTDDEPEGEIDQEVIM